MGGRRRRVALVPGFLLIAGGVALGADPYMDRHTYERAPYCAEPEPATDEDCVGRVELTVVSRSTYKTKDWAPDNPPPQPPPARLPRCRSRSPGGSDRLSRTRRSRGS